MLTQEDWRNWLVDNQPEPWIVAAMLEAAAKMEAAAVNLRLSPSYYLHHDRLNDATRDWRKAVIEAGVRDATG